LPPFERGSDHILRVTEFLRLPWLEHGFGTRHSQDWPPPERLISLKQIHSDIVFNADAAEAGRIGDGDGLILSRPGLLAGIRTADCQPILLVDEVHRVVAAVHAGWRGTAAEIGVKAVRRMGTEYGSDPNHILAAIGPSIGNCCYEVGPEVASQFQKFFPERDDLDRKTRIDLTEANRRQLLKAGVKTVITGAPCTCCDFEFHSYRRDKSDWRMYSVVGIRDTKGAESTAPLGNPGVY
jgi:YfiH family protein